jgi:catechol 2,3-dioxygenase-like lactoylglutathione lyase family enzyme
MTRPRYGPGRNIAMKVPAHEYERTVAFYRDVLGLEELEGAPPSATETARFAFGDKVLWVDRVPGISQAEIWLEIVSDDVEAAAAHLEASGCARRDEIEPLPPDFEGFWISSPSNIIHLVTSEGWEVRDER